MFSFFQTNKANLDQLIYKPKYTRLRRANKEHATKEIGFSVS